MQRGILAFVSVLLGCGVALGAGVAPGAVPSDEELTLANAPSTIWTVKYHRNTPGGGEDAERSQNFVVGKQQRLLYLDSQLGWSCRDEGGFSYTFLGWAKSKTGAAVYSNGQQVCDLVAAGKVLHLYAAWQKRAYQVIYHSNDEDAKTATQEFRPGIAKTLLWLDSGLKWTRYGYDFLGWAKSPTGGAVYKNGQKVVDLVDVGKTLHLYAAWRCKFYTVRLHKNDSQDDVSVDQAFMPGETKSLLWVDSNLHWGSDYWDPTHTVRTTFWGWALGPGRPPKYLNGEKVCDLAEPGAVLDLYAVWSVTQIIQPL